MGSAPFSGEPASATAVAMIFSRSAAAARFTAGPTVAAVQEPPETGVSGIWVSPRSERTFCMGSPSSSAAICAITV